MRKAVSYAFTTLLVCLSALLFAGSASAYQPGSEQNLKTLVMLINFPDDLSTPVTTAQVKDVMFTGAHSVNEFYLEDSWGKFGFTGINQQDGDVIGYITSPVNKTDGCNGSAMTDGLDAQATLLGYNVAAYDRVVYVAPTCPNGRSFAGIATGRAWIVGNAWSSIYAWAHELGHDMPIGPGDGQGHANAMYCDEGGFPTTSGDRCFQAGYADENDIMGNSVRLRNSFNRIAAGFLPMSTSTTASAPGVYDLYGTDEQPIADHTYNLRIPIREPIVAFVLGGTFNTGGSNGFLNLEYRRPRGYFDQNLSPSTTTTGATIRFARDYGEVFDNMRTETYLVDTEPRTRPFLGWRKGQGHSWFEDYYYEQEYGEFDPLTTDTGYYDPDSDVLLRVVERDSQKIQIEYSKGFAAFEQTSVEVSNRVLTVTAQTGWANDIYLRADNDGNIVVRDGNAPLSLTGGCSRSAKNVALCPVSAIDQVVVNTGDRRDYVDANLPVPATIDGGAGDDVLVGGGEIDVIDGGDGVDKIIANGANDLVSGGAGGDNINTGAGDDIVTGLDGSVDSVSCGDGGDEVETELGDLLDETCEPAGPVDTAIASGPAAGGFTTDDTPVFTFRATSSAATFECSVDGGSNWNPCASPYTTPSLPAGTQSFAVRAVVAGVPDATSAVRSFTVEAADLQGPVISITSPTSLMGGSSHLLSFVTADPSGVAGATCAIDGGASFGCVSGSQITVSGDGAHTLAVTATDTLSNARTATVRFIVDGTGPSISVFGPTGTVHSAQPRPWFNITDANNLSDVWCVVDSGDPFGCIDYHALQPLSDGVHTLIVGATDQAGNMSSALVSFTVDTTGAWTYIDSGPANGSVLDTTTVQFAFHGNSSYDTDAIECKMDADLWRGCLSNTIFATAAEGPHTFSVRAVDRAGNPDPTPATRSFAIDRTSPDVSIQSPSEGSTVANPVSAEFAATDDNLAGVTCVVDANPPVACASPLALGNLAAGPHSFEVTAIDAAGHASSASVSFDVTGAIPTPVITSVTGAPQNGAVIGTSVPAFGGTEVIDGSMVTVKNGATVLCASAPVSGGTWSCASSVALADGTYEGVTAVAGYGDPNESSESAPAAPFTIDTTSPAVTIDPIASPTRDQTPDITFDVVEANLSSVTCRIDSDTPVSCTSPFTPSYVLDDGGHDVFVTATDALGNAHTASAPFVVDNTVPVVSLTSPVGTITTSTPTIVFTATDPSGVTVNCRIDDASYRTCTSGMVWDTALSEGGHTLWLQAIDGVGNAMSIPYAFTVDLPEPEVRNVTVVTPPSGTHSLTNEGVVDWSHWGRSLATGWDHKSSGGAQVSNLATVTPTGASPATTLTRVSSSVAPTASWSDGTPTASSSGTATGVTNTQSGQGRGVALTVANLQNSELVTLRLHAGVLNTTGKLELYWSSNPGSVISNTSVTAGSSVVNRIYQIALRPPQTTDTLNVRFLQNTTSSSGKVRVYSASLAKLAAVKSTAPASADLTATGTLDWAHWGTSGTSLTQTGKASATEIQTPAVKVGLGSVTQATAAVNPVTTSFSWTNGDSPVSNAGTQTGISTGAASGRGFSFTVPAASANRKTLKLFVGVTNTTGKLDLFWGSNTIPVLTDASVSNSSGTTNAVYSIDLRHATAGTTLKVQFTQNTSSSSGRVTLQSAALY